MSAFKLNPVMIATPPSVLSILVADDEEGIRSLFVTWLGKFGHSVTCAATGRHAMDLIARQHFDLVITDVMMPDGDGFELIPEVRRNQPDARILVISGGGQYIPSSECLALARGLGAHGAILKPFHWEQARSVISAVFPAGVELGAEAAA